MLFELPTNWAWVGPENLDANYLPQYSIGEDLRYQLIIIYITNPAQMFKDCFWNFC